MDNVTLFDIQGWLYKRSEILGLWKKKFITFCKTDHVLKWFTTNNPAEEASGWIDLRGFQYIFSEQGFDFTITNSTSSWFFQTWDEKGKKKWQTWLEILHQLTPPIGHPAHSWQPANFLRTTTCCLCSHPISRFTKETYCGPCCQAAHGKCLQAITASKADTTSCKLVTPTCNCKPETHSKLAETSQDTPPEEELLHAGDLLSPAQTLEKQPNQSEIIIIDVNAFEFSLTDSWVWTDHTELTFFWHLPTDIIFNNLFCYLNGTDLSVLAQVSKGMNTMADNNLLWTNLISRKGMDGYMSPGIQSAKIFYKYFLHPQPCCYCQKKFIPVHEEKSTPVCTGHTGKYKLVGTTEGVVPGVSLEQRWDCCNRLSDDPDCHDHHHQMETPEHLQTSFLEAIGFKLQTVAVGGSVILKIGVSPVLVSGVMAYHLFGGALSLCTLNNAYNLTRGTVLATANSVNQIVQATAGGAFQGVCRGIPVAEFISPAPLFPLTAMAAVAIGTGCGFFLGCISVCGQLIALPFELLQGKPSTLVNQNEVPLRTFPF